MKLVLLGLDIPEQFLGELRDQFDGTYEFQKFNPRHFDARLISTAEVLVLISSNEDVISKASACRWVHSWSAGVDDYLSVERFRSANAPALTNSAGSYGTQISEHVFALIFAFTRGIKAIVLNQEKRRWEVPQHVDGPAELSEIRGKTIGIVGLGHVGLEVARTAKAFGLGVLGVRRDPSKEFRKPNLSSYLDEIFSTEELATVLSRSDFVVNALPLTIKTKGLFNRSNFSRFKEGALFLSIGRGGTVVEADLVDALREGKVGSAALDVFSKEPLPEDSPLWKMKNVIISPHCAGRSDLHFAKAFGIFRDNLARYSKNEPLLNRIDIGIGY
ncbi:MAG TPA: D-2-hydroxyacid dehydrogenase [Nitrososphaerales archaeon]|nr:D-2-hydroxyacid dehydrogenase [Nitrososphaerales archaeon]